MHLVSPSSHLNMFNAPFEGILQGYTHGVFIIELSRASVISTMHACDLVRNMSLFPLQLTNTLSKAFLCSPPALHCLKTSWDTSSFPLAGLGGTHPAKRLSLDPSCQIIASYVACGKGFDFEMAGVPKAPV